MTSSTTNNKIAPASTKPTKAGKVPVEPEFWKRYSPHYEFPLSLSSSVFLHIFAAGFLALMAYVFVQWIHEDQPLPVGGIAIGGGGGDPHGVAKGNENGPIQSDKEATTEGKNPDPVTNPTESAELSKPEAAPPKLNDAPAKRYFNPEDAKLGSQKLADLGMKVSSRLKLRSKGKGGPGSGGGEGGGKGTGTGTGSGPGTGTLNDRERRRNRWIMIFNTHSGQDYANQLAGLGAILGVLGADGQYTLYRDLHHRPVKGKIEDPNELNRIFWEDNKRESVTSLSNALGIKPVPDSLMAFFPEELEKQLLDLELAAFGGKEDEIAETFFRVEKRSGGKYVPVVNYQARK